MAKTDRFRYRKEKREKGEKESNPLVATQCKLAKFRKDLQRAKRKVTELGEGIVSRENHIAKLKAKNDRMVGEVSTAEANVKNLADLIQRTEAEVEKLEAA